ncbi:hypothetical protein Tco_1284272 [Tanacetum coccineum]
MKIPNWMITDEMKLTENYHMYAEVFGVDVPTTQYRPIKSTHGMHRTPNPEEDESEEDDYELRRRIKGKHVDDYRNIQSPTPIRSLRIHSTLISLDTEKP